MIDKIDGILKRQEELLAELAQPDTASDPARMTVLMKEQAQLAPIADTYREYLKAEEDENDSLLMLEEEQDEEMRQMLREEQAASKE